MLVSIWRIWCIFVLFYSKISSDGISVFANNSLNEIDDKVVETVKCDLYLAPSLISGAGRGIFAGRQFNQEETVDNAPAMTVKHSKLLKWPLNNYVYSSEDDLYSMVLFGPAMLFNHRNPRDVEHTWNEWPVSKVSDQKAVPHATYTSVDHATTRDIMIGEEIFTSYGEDDWFDARGIFFDKLPIEVPSYTLEELEKEGHCLTNVYVDKSNLPMAGKGLFASKDFKKNDIVSISPVLILPKHEIITIGSENVIQNYCFNEEGSDVALFPLGLAAMMNHGGIETNLEITWYSWSNNTNDNFAKALKKTGDELLKEKFAQLDISYRATRDIVKGEELYINYGEAWEERWVKYLDDLSIWYDNNNEITETDDLSEEDKNSLNDSKPKFRHFIEAPNGLFPKWWKTACIGEDCQMINKQAEIDKDESLKKKQNEARLKVQAAIERARQVARKNYVKKTPNSSEKGTCSKSKLNTINEKSEEMPKSTFTTSLYREILGIFGIKNDNKDAL